ncbi:hypothetical protein ULMA_16660 [Patiriisocius marinus]|uniref:Uncharacterized protein n=1 Tax=Patiriisocius marinus TaxID=1397112 RepID=A0A5J4J0R6_9FLAO|nr:hypothetical protein [Patiriisocius marinus]GER59558.1 hypothetical protein ULMA_16660 [Patiriisocius marinus]
MYKIIITISLTIVSIVVNAQEKTHPKLLTNDAQWGVETFNLPTGFAQEMTLKGFEEAIFHPDWSNIEKPGFWSYVFTWSVVSDSLINEKDIEQNLILYFDGLVDIPKDTVIAPKRPSSALIIQTTKNNNNSKYIGKVRLYDRFKTKQMLRLNLTVEQKLCPQQKKSILIFRFSPKSLEHDIWKQLNTLILRDTICN